MLYLLVWNGQTKFPASCWLRCRSFHIWTSHCLDWSRRFWMAPWIRTDRRDRAANRRDRSHRWTTATRSLWTVASSSRFAVCSPIPRRRDARLPTVSAYKRQRACVCMSCNVARLARRSVDRGTWRDFSHIRVSRVPSCSVPT